MADERVAPQPPHSQEAEESVVGGILLHSTVYNRVVPLVHAGDFYHPALRSIFDAFVDLDTASKPIDSLTVAEQMRESGTFSRLNAFNGQDYLVELQTRVVTTENIEYYAKIIAGKAKVRRIAAVCHEIAAKAYGDYGEVDEFLAESERRFFEVHAKGERRGPRRLRAIMHDVVKSVEKRFSAGDRPLGVPSGWKKHDELTAGYQAGDLVIVAARPSMGKSSYAGNILINAAEAEIPGLIFSLEMSDQALGERMAAAKGDVDSQHIRTGRMTPEDWRNLMNAASALAKKNVFIDDAGDNTVMQIRAAARRWRTEETDPEQLAVVVIDYLQLVTGSGREDNRQAEVAFISRNLKSLAKELRCPVIALSQLNRKLEERSDKRPQMSDLRESGALEQDADVIEFIYRDEVYHADTKYKGIAEINVAKQRMGPTGVVMLRWRPSFSRFDALEEKTEAGQDDED